MSVRSFRPDRRGDRPACKTAGMLLGGITIPEALITAHEEGRLVIFTGAGISIAPPSNLPSFLALCEQVAAKSARG